MGDVEQRAAELTEELKRFLKDTADSATVALRHLADGGRAHCAVAAVRQCATLARLCSVRLDELRNLIQQQQTGDDRE